MNFFYNDPMEYEYTQSVKASSAPCTPVDHETINSDAIVEQLDSFTLDDSVQNQQEPNSRQDSTEMVKIPLKEPTPTKEPTPAKALTPTMAPTPTQEKEEHSVVPFKTDLSFQNEQQIPTDTPLTPALLNNNILNYYSPVQDPVNHLTYVKYLIIFTFFCGAIYVCSVLGQTIRLDMNEMIAAKEAGMLSKKYDCARSFDLNNCHYEDLVPAAIPFCREWEECIHGPIIVNRLELMADYIGSMYYAFFSRLSWQDKIVFLSLFSACLWAIKCILIALVASYT